MKKYLVFALLLVFAFVSVLAITAENVVDEMVKANSNFKTQKIVMKMQVKKENALTKNYELVIYVYNKGENQKYALVRFTSPASVRGLSFLSMGKEKEYLYMPAYHRIQRIAGSSKNSKFAGSDFTYNDLSLLYSQKEEGKYTMISQNASVCVLKIVPTESDAMYSKIVMTVDMTHLLPLKVEFYKNGKLYKTMKNSELEKVQGRWVFKKITLSMADGSSETTLELVHTSFDLKIPPTFFSVRTLFMPVLRY